MSAPSSYQAVADQAATAIVAPAKKVALMLPVEALQALRAAPASSGGYPMASPQSNAHKTIQTPSNASTAWRQNVCPAPPTRPTRFTSGSLDPSPVVGAEAPFLLGDMSPANIWQRDRYSVSSMPSIASTQAKGQTTPQSSAHKTPSNASTAWRQNVCPAPPARPDRFTHGSVDPSPVARAGAPSPYSDISPANIWPDRNRFVSVSSLPTAASSPSGASSITSEAVHLSFPERQAFAGNGLAAQMFADATPASRSGASLFSADLTPITAEAGIPLRTMSQGSLEWLAPVMNAPTPVSGDATPMSFFLPKRGMSSNSLLNNAIIMDTPMGSAWDSSASTPVSFMANGEQSKKGSTTSSLGFGFFAPMGDGGPPMCARGLGA